jgi:hypothetical protein
VASSSVEVIRIESAAAFVEALRPTSPRWSQRGAWLFRGHGRLNWPLRPTAFRPESWEKLGGHPGVYSNDQMDKFEIDELLHFARGLNHAGLPIPGMGRAEIARWDGADSKVITADWVEAFSDLMALAQHHGFPTRLLDFTHQSLVAAYFAALPLPDCDPLDDSPDELCVWAIDASRLDWKSDEWVRIVRATKAGNPNLIAQDGVFVVWKSAWQTLDAIIDGLIDEYADYPDKDDRDEGPSACQLTLPRKESIELLALLAREHVTGARLFPGVDGVIRAHYEQKLHRVYPPDSGLGTFLDYWNSELGSQSGPRPPATTEHARVRIPQDARALLQQLKAQKGKACTTDALLLEALNLLFKEHGVGPVHE